jgi:hypothetical protein
VLLDVMTFVDEVDVQLTQSMDSYMKVMRKSRRHGCPNAQNVSPACH